jgi:hypothetical protein
VYGSRCHSYFQRSVGILYSVTVLSENQRWPCMSAVHSINVVHLSHCPHVWRNSCGKWQTVVVGWNKDPVLKMPRPPSAWSLYIYSSLLCPCVIRQCYPVMLPAFSGMWWRHSSVTQSATVWSEILTIQFIKQRRNNRITGLNRPLEFQEVEAPRVPDNRRMKVVRLSTLRTGRLYPPGNIPGCRFC